MILKLRDCCNTNMCVPIHIYTYIYSHTYVHLCTYIYLYAGLQIDSVVSQNTNHFWGNCESLRQSESQNRESLSADL